MLSIICIGRTSAQGSICAVGGGSEDYGSWSDKPYSWIVKKADSGRIAVLSYSSQTDWIPNYFKSLGASGVEKLIINSRETADSEEIYSRIVSSEGIFIKGGDQWKYYSYFKDTRTEEAIKVVYNNGGIVAGTSAGAMILGEFIFSAENGSAHSRESLLNPKGRDITIEKDFISLHPNLLFDTHNIERGRIGRLIAFWLNIFNEEGRNITAVGIDDKTALCIDENKIGRVMGSGSASIIQADEGTVIGYDNMAYTIENLRYDQLLEDWSYDFSSNRIEEFSDDAVIPAEPKETAGTETDILLVGKDYFWSDIKKSLDIVIDDLTSGNIAVISSSNSSAEVNELSDVLNENNCYYKIVYTDSAAKNLNEYINTINSAETALLIGSDENDFFTLTDTSDELGRKLHYRIKNGISTILVGTLANLSTNEFYGKSTDDKYASYYGNLSKNPGLSITRSLAVKPEVYSDSDHFENNISGLITFIISNE